MANIQGTTIAAAIVPFNTLDNFATHLALYGKGGHRTVNTNAERNAISPDRRELLMTVAVIEDSITYKLISDPITVTTEDTDWENANNIGINTISIVNTDDVADSMTLYQNTFYKSINIVTCKITLDTAINYAKIVWYVEIDDTIPTLTFSNNILWRYANDLVLSSKSVNVFEFETWNEGVIWLGKVSKYSFITPEVYMDEKTVEGEINDAMGWSVLT